MNAQLKQQQNWVVTASLSTLAILAISVALYFTRDILIPFVIAIFIGSLVSPLMDVMELKWKWRHSISVGVALVVVMLATLLFGLILIASIQTIAGRAKEYEDKLGALSDHIESKALAFTGEAEDNVPGNKPQEPSESEELDSGDVPQSEEALVAGASRQDTQDAGDIQDKEDSNDASVEPDQKSPMKKYFLGQIPVMARWLLGQTATLFSGATLTLIFVMFVLAGRQPNVVRQGVYKDIDTQVRSYISTKVALSIGTGLLVWLSLWIVEMPMAAVFGLLAFLFNFIPSVGSIISTLVPLPFAILHVFDPGTGLNSGVIMFLVAVICLPGAIQMLIGNVLEPKLMGNDLQLHPITILLALAIWGLLWGPIGMLLAVPMTAIIRIVLMKFEITQIAGKALAGELPDLDAAEKKAAGAGGQTAEHSG